MNKLSIEDYRKIDDEAAKKAYDAFAGPRRKRSAKEKMRDALAMYEKHRSKQSLPFCGVTQEELDAGDKIRDAIESSKT